MVEKEKRTLGTIIKNWFVEPDDMPKSMRQGKGRFVFFMVIISLLHFIIFYIGANYKSIALAFQSVDFIDENGLVHYKYKIGGDVGTKVTIKAGFRIIANGVWYVTAEDYTIWWNGTSWVETEVIP